MKPKPWRTVSSREIYENPWMRLREDVAEMPDDTESLERRVFPFDEALSMALQGEIMDGMSMIGLLLAARRRAESVPPAG